ncbi:MAG: hypothetical protein GY906_13095 [bacterium]|nr:hypothetical protein [bacterium]
MTNDELKKAARDAVRTTIKVNGVVATKKRKAARASVPFRQSPDQRLQHMITLTDRARRQVNGNLFKLEPDVPVEPEDLAGEFTPDRKAPEPKAVPTLWDQVFAEERLTLEDLLPYRIRSCWRIVREMARLKGLIADDEGLDVVLAMKPDPWIEPSGYAVEDKALYSRLNAEVSEQLRDISLLPPKAPSIRPDGAVDPTYDPNSDVLLAKYMRTTHFLSLYLQIERGSVTDPSQGRYGLYGIGDPTLIRLAFPSRLQILAWEEIVVEETFKCMTEVGQSGAEEFLQDTYGLRPFEVNSIIKLAKSRARSKLENDLEEDRAVMVFRLEELARRAKDGLDLRVELGALKQMALVMGLGRTDPEDSLRDFIDVVARVSDGEKRKVEIPTKPARLIEG